MNVVELASVTRWGKLPAWWLLHPGVDADRFAVLAALATYADENGFCEPSQGTLAKRLCRSRPWANRVVADLAGIGMLRKQGRARSNGGTTSCRYQLAQTPEQAQEFLALGPTRETAVAARTRPVRSSDTPCQPDDTNHADLEHIQNSRSDARAATLGKEVCGPKNVEVTPSREWLPSEAAVTEALRLCPDANLDEHTAHFVARCRAKGYRYASMDDAWLEWLLSDRRSIGREKPAVASRPSSLAWRSAPRSEHRFARFDAWATSASAPITSAARC